MRRWKKESDLIRYRVDRQNIWRELDSYGLIDIFYGETAVHDARSYNIRVRTWLHVDVDDELVLCGSFQGIGPWPAFSY